MEENAQYFILSLYKVNMCMLNQNMQSNQSDNEVKSTTGYYIMVMLRSKCKYQNIVPQYIYLVIFHRCLYLNNICFVALCTNINIFVKCINLCPYNKYQVTSYFRINTLFCLLREHWL